MADAEREASEHLRRLWDGLLAGEPFATDEDELELAALVRCLYALDAADVAPSPDPRFARRLEIALMHEEVEPMHGQATMPANGFASGALPIAPSATGRYAVPGTPTGAAPKRFSDIVPAVMAAAVVLLTLAGVFVAYSLAPGRGDGPPSVSSTQGGDPGGRDVPSPNECRAAPTTIDRITPSGTPAAESVALLPAGPPRVVELPRVPLDGLPTDSLADEKTTAGVTATVRELTACLNALDLARHSALFTDDHWRRAQQTGASLVLQFPLEPGFDFPAPFDLPVADMDAMPIVTEVQALPDGRVRALVVGGLDELDPEFTVFAYPRLYVLARGDDGWLVDDVVEVLDTVATAVRFRNGVLEPSQLNLSSVDRTIVFVLNLDDAPLGFVVPFLDVRADVAAGEVGSVALHAQAEGEYAIYDDASAGPNQTEELLGRIVVDQPEEEAPAGTPVAASPAAAAGTVVRLADIFYDPKNIAIPANTDVRLTLSSVGESPHSFVIDALGIDLELRTDETREVTINAPAGEYEYYCVPPGHKAAGMVSTLRVG